MLCCMSRAAAPLAMSDGHREVLGTLTGSRAVAHRVVQRAQVLLLPAEGVSNTEIAETCPPQKHQPRHPSIRLTAHGGSDCVSPKGACSDLIHRRSQLWSQFRSVRWRSSGCWRR